MPKPILNLFFVAVFSLGLYLFLKLLWPFLVPFVLAIILVSVFYNWYEAILQKLKNETAASIVTCAIVVLIVMVPVGLLMGLLGKEAFSLVVWAKDNLQTESVQDFLQENKWVSQQISTVQTTFHLDLSPEHLREQIGSAGKNIGLFVYEQARRITSNIFSVVFNFVILIFILFYLFKDGDEILKKLMYLSPLSSKQEWHIIEKIRQVGGAVFWGNLMSALFQGIVGGIGFLVFGLGNAALVGLATAIVSLIPAVGTLIIYIPGAAFLYLTGHLVAGIGLLVYGLILSNVIDNIIKPKMIQNKIQIHPLLVFFSILGGVQVFGLLGILYGPIIVTLFLSILDIYKNDFIKEVK